LYPPAGYKDELMDFPKIFSVVMIIMLSAEDHLQAIYQSRIPGPGNSNKK